jgi:hypothetical protein
MNPTAKNAATARLTAADRTCIGMIARVSTRHY